MPLGLREWISFRTQNATLNNSRGRHPTFYIAAGGDIDKRLTSGNDERNVIIKLSKSFLGRVWPQTKTEAEVTTSSLHLPQCMFSSRFFMYQVVLILQH